MELIDSIVVALEAKRCPKHQKPPFVKVVDGEFQIQSCCREFGNECSGYVTSVLISRGLGFIRTKGEPDKSLE